MNIILMNYQKKKILDEVDHYICISHNTKKDLVEYYNIDEKKISVTHLGSSMNIIQNVEYKIDKPFFLLSDQEKDIRILDYF